MIKPCTPQRLPPRNLDWKLLVPLIGEARAALARYDALLSDASPTLFEELKWKESIASLKGQNIKTSLKEMVQFSRDLSAEETRFPFLLKIANAKKGLDFAIRWAKSKPLGIPFFCRLHSIVKSDAPNAKEIGKLREKQNWIGPHGKGIEDAYFLPPPPKLVKRHLSALIRYSNGKEKDPLVQLAIFFAQFLIIHPFMDGNGRVARIFIPIFLWKKGLLSKPFFFLSSYFEKHRLQYFQKLFDISENNDWESWVVYFLKGVIEQSREIETLNR